ncbi:hypothetical protein ACCO45_002409 [Purpureocillium lilacinum]|uniref:Uncharacterized protein n=1 Tax=Purpureocillium lilacinum TaxID=33203 RepID=A0ACC4EC11_PURLI
MLSMHATTTPPSARSRVASVAASPHVAGVPSPPTSRALHPFIFASQPSLFSVNDDGRPQRRRETNGVVPLPSQRSPGHPARAACQPEGSPVKPPSQAPTYQPALRGRRAGLARLHRFELGPPVLERARAAALPDAAAGVMCELNWGGGYRLSTNNLPAAPPPGCWCKL